MNKERLLKIAGYLRETEIPDWNFGDVFHCAFPHFYKIFPEDFSAPDQGCFYCAPTESNEAKLKSDYLGLSGADMSLLFLHRENFGSDKLPGNSTKEQVAQNIENFVKRQELIAINDAPNPIMEKIADRIKKNPKILDEIKDRLENDEIVD